MTTPIASSGGSARSQGAGPAAPTGAAALATGQLPPATEAPLPAGLDGLTRMLLLVNSAGQDQIRISGEKAELVKQRNAEAMKQLMQKLAEIAEELRKAQEAANRPKGFFEKLFAPLADAISKFTGQLAETLRDAVVVPLETTVALARTGGDLNKVAQALGKSLDSMVEDSGDMKAVEQFTRGTLELVGSYCDALRAGLDAIVTGDPSAFVDALKGAWGDLKDNVLKNPGFMQVLKRAVQVMAVASAALSFGAASGISLAIIVALEVNSRTNFIEKAVGKDAAPWVVAGLAIVGCACGAVFTGGAVSAGGANPSTLAAVARGLGAGAKMITGVSTVVVGLEAKEAADRNSRIVHLQAEAKGLDGAVARLHRVMDSILSEYEERTQSATRQSSRAQRLIDAKHDAVMAGTPTAPLRA